jgi:hypothetical protein
VEVKERGNGSGRGKAKITHAHTQTHTHTHTLTSIHHEIKEFPAFGQVQRQKDHITVPALLPVCMCVCVYMCMCEN